MEFRDGDGGGGVAVTRVSEGGDLFDGRGARQDLRGIAGKKLRENAYAQVRGDRRGMPGWIFPTALSGFTALRLFCIAVMIAAAQGWFLDSASWATGAPVTAEYHTPFHGHPNLYGWRWAFQGLVRMHAVTGAGLLLVCLVPLFAKKGGRVHGLFGRAFVAIWSLHLLNGLINSAQILMTRGFDPTRYLSSTGQGFSLYLYVQFAFISALVVDFLAHGLAALHFKNRAPSAVVRASMIGLPLTSTLFGAIMATWAVQHLTGARVTDASPMATEFAVVYLVQVPAYVFLAGKNILYWLRPEPRIWLQGWVTEHQRNMMFCVGVTLYTAAANLTMRFAPQLTAPIFASIDVGFLVWLLTKERLLRRGIVGGRMALAVASHLQGVRGTRSTPHIGQREAAWILRMFDQDGNGKLELPELQRLLAAQGVGVHARDLERLFRALDRDADGRIDRAELADFLSRGFTGDTTREEELAYCFRRLDADGDGRISGDELRAAAQRAGQETGASLGRLADGVERRAGAAVGFGTFARAVESRRGSA